MSGRRGRVGRNSRRRAPGPPRRRWAASPLLAARGAVQQLVPGELHARPSAGAEVLLVGVDPLPSAPADRLDAALGEQVCDVALADRRRSGARPRRPRAGWSPPPARPSCSCRSRRSGRGGSSPSRTRPSRGARRRRRVRRRSGSCRGSRRREPPGSRCPCSRSSAAPGRIRPSRARRSAARPVTRPHGARGGCARPRCARSVRRPAARQGRSGSAARSASASRTARAPRTRAGSARSRASSCRPRRSRATPAKPRPARRPPGPRSRPPARARRAPAARGS